MDTTAATTPALPDPTDLDAVRAWLACHTPVLPAVRAWLTRVTNTSTGIGIDAGGTALCSGPVFGTPAWVALADDDPRKLAAALDMAYAHLVEQTPAAIERRVRAELEETARSWRQAVKDASAAMSEYVAARGYHVGPSHTELVRRRASYPCGDCGQPLRYPVTLCRCGWTQPTPDQLRARATASWADTTTAASGGKDMA